MDVNERVKYILEKYGWTRYKFSKTGAVPETTLSNIFNHKTTPNIATIEAICKTLNLTLADFFAEDERVELTPELKKYCEALSTLTPEKREFLMKMVDYLK